MICLNVVSPYVLMRLVPFTEVIGGKYSFVLLAVEVGRTLTWQTAAA